MNKLVKIFTVLALIFTVTAGAYAKAPNISAKEREKIEKQNLKAAKKVVKEKKKAGWVFEQTGMPEDIVAKFMNSRDIQGLEELQGTAENSASRSKARSYIATKTANEYAQAQSIVLKGKLNGMDTGNEEEINEEFVRQWEGRYAMEVAGILKIGYSMYRKNDNGTVDMEIHYLVDPENAHAAKLSAARNALERQKLKQEWADAISKALSDIEPE